MPIRYPSLIPNTVSIGLKDITDKIHTYDEVYRLPKRSRIFNGFFKKDGRIFIRENAFVTKIQNVSRIAKDVAKSDVLPR
jgi:hypothetical protein